MASLSTMTKARSSSSRCCGCLVCAVVACACSDVARLPANELDAAGSEPDAATSDGTTVQVDAAADAFGVADRNIRTRDLAGDTMKNDASGPTVKGSVYTFNFGDTVFAVDASKGGRIVTFSLAGKNILTAAKSSSDNNWGSTFWPSPQRAWDWPPPAEIDPGSYKASVSGGVLSMTSATNASLGLAVSKEFSVDPERAMVTIVYGLTNKGSKATSVGPWEITRVAAGGLTFFPMGEGTPSKGTQDLLKLQILDGVAYFAYDAKLITNDQKVFADGHEGWIAHVDGDLLLLKAFSDTTPAQAAPSEAEIEIYTDAGHSYIEVENQGAYVSVEPGASTTWTVRWFLRRLESSVSLQPGSPDLLAVVRSLLK